MFGFVFHSMGRWWVASEPPTPLDSPSALTQLFLTRWAHPHSDAQRVEHSAIVVEHKAVDVQHPALPPRHDAQRRKVKRACNGTPRSRGPIQRQGEGKGAASFRLPPIVMRKVPLPTGRRTVAGGAGVDAAQERGCQLGAQIFRAAALRRGKWVRGKKGPQQRLHWINQRGKVMKMMVGGPGEGEGPGLFELTSNSGDAHADSSTPTFTRPQLGDVSPGSPISAWGAK